MAADRGSKFDAECRELFQLFDTRDEGAIATTQLGSMLRAVGLSMQPAALMDAMYSAGIKEGGTFSRASFLQIAQIALHKVGGQDDELKELFRAADSDGDGFLTADDLRSVLAGLQSCFGCRVCLAEREQVVKEVIFDNSGLVSVEDLLAQVS
eukprot:PLAT1641.1.p1 GENE.PLAT1641.1~~PLAT1641.1.p1  ORF type:complete len:153 (+),score=4.94 PLAT1641.1:228-686(+)